MQLIAVKASFQKLRIFLCKIRCYPWPQMLAVTSLEVTGHLASLPPGSHVSTPTLCLSGFFQGKRMLCGGKAASLACSPNGLTRSCRDDQCASACTCHVPAQNAEQACARGSRISKTNNFYPLSRPFLSTADIMTSSRGHAAVMRPVTSRALGCCPPDSGSDADSLPSIGSVLLLQRRRSERTRSVLRYCENTMELGNLCKGFGSPGTYVPHLKNC